MDHKLYYCKYIKGGSIVSVANTTMIM